MRWWIVGAAAVLLAAALLVSGAGTEPARQARVVGVLTSAAVALPAFDGFRDGIGEVGGLPVHFLFRGVTNDETELTVEARRLIGDGAELILAMTTRAAQAALDAGREHEVPVLFAPASNPVETGLVETMRRPGGLATGVTFGRQEARRLEWLQRLVPGLDRVYVPYTRDDPSPLVGLPLLQEAARTLGISLLLDPVAGWEELREKLARLPDGVRAIFITPDPGLSSHARELSAFARDRGIALTTPHRDGVEQGALMSYGFDLYSLGLQAARQGALVLSGVRPAGIPVETAEFSLSVNLETARRIGLEIPPSILRQALVVP